MANPKHLEILGQGVEVWNRWREENPDARPNLSEVDLSGADLSGAKLSGAKLSGADLRQADLRGANLTRADLRGAKLRPGDPTMLQFSDDDARAEIRGADLSRADLSKANRLWADLSRADLSRADLSKAKLYGADLSEVDRLWANLSRADLSRADLSEVDRLWADLLRADLSGVNLSRADLSEANLSRAKLSKAKLYGADLSEANLREANLSGADISGASVGYTVFSDVDLSMVKGLETMRHYGPSYIDIHTIYRSRGKIPEAFLRGAGVPDTFIAFIASLTGEAIQYYSCFISYSTKDEAFAQRLHNDLQGKGVRCWFAPEDIQGGRKLYDQIDQAIRLHDKLLLVLSEHSIHSKWVETEIRRARKAEARDKRRKLFPIRLVDWETIRDWECFDADTGKDLAVEVREYFVPDFSHWKDHDSYHQAFDRLLRDLKASEA